MAGETKRSTDPIQFNTTGVGASMIVGDSKPKVIIHLVNIVSRFCYACGSPVCTLGLHTSVYWKTYSGPFWDRSTPAILVSKQSQSAARWACEPLHVSKQSQSADRWASEPLHVNHLLPSSPDPLQQTINSAQCAAQDISYTIRSSTQPNVPPRTIKGMNFDSIKVHKR